MVNGVATGFDKINYDSPDFYIHELYPLDFFGTTVYITTTHICTFIVIVSIMVLAVFARNSVLKTKDAPSKFATGVEIAISTLINFC